AAEVEEVARTHPAIEDCAMIGVAADIGEAEIKLFVALKRDAHLSAHEPSEWLSTRLARFPRPAFITHVYQFHADPTPANQETQALAADGRCLGSGSGRENDMRLGGRGHPKGRSI